jgi:hypothetical protein
MGAMLLPTIWPAHLRSSPRHSVRCWPFGVPQSKVKRLVLIIGIFFSKLLDMSPMQNNEDDGCNRAWNAKGVNE